VVEALEFDSLAVTPYVTDRGRLACSLRDRDQGRPQHGGRGCGLMPAKRFRADCSESVRRHFA